GSANVSILRNAGAGTFTSAGSVGVGTTPRDLVAGDFDADGDLDLVVAGYGTQQTCINWTYYGCSQYSYELINNKVVVLIGSGAGTFQAGQSYSGGAPSAVTAADFNGDGKLDLAVANPLYADYYSGFFADRTVSVRLGHGTGTFQAPVNSTVGLAPRSVAAADLDGDGRLDLVSANAVSGTVSVLKGVGDGSFQAAPGYVVGSSPLSVAAADLDGDADQDLVVANYGSGTVSVLRHNGSGVFQQAVTQYPAGLSPQGLAVADFNTDGHPDLAVANLMNPGTVSVLLGKAGGGFQAAVSYAAGAYPYGIAVGDFDGNGAPDLVVTNYL